MALVSQKQMHYEVLELMQDAIVRSRKQIEERVIEVLSLTEDEIQLRTSSGAPVYKSRADWAISLLYKLGFLERVRKGSYQVSVIGKQRFVEGITADDISVLLNKTKKSKKSKEFAENSNESDVEISEIVHSEEQSPIEIIESSLNDLNDALASELLSEILSKSPAFFESLVVDLLVKMGYGAGKITQYVGDGGIDGKISVDPLGLDMIYIQAKRYAIENSVGRPDIQSFAGAMNKVTRGVFITTSSFTQEAKEFARAYSNGTIVLIDGKELTKLMIKYGLGVSTEHVYEIKHIDSDYFE